MLGSGHRQAIWLFAACLTVFGLLGCGQAKEAPTLVAEVPPPQGHSRIAEEQPPHPQPPYDVAPEPAAHSQRAPEPKPAAKPETAPEAEAGGSGASSIPPASAGSNGSFTPPPAGEREEITPRTMEKLARQTKSQSAVLLNGVALAPPGAPQRIKAAISAANQIIGRPYIWGGGHDSWYSRGYDCSGAVSYALAGGGFLSTPLDSSQLMSWGAPGRGRWLTVYANAGHAYAVIAGLRWDTVGDARGSGPRWHPALPYPEGFVARHPPGY
jgi:cell wall-associated NlpC family hydrolase